MKTKEPVTKSYMGKVYIDGKYKSMLTPDQFPIRESKKIQYIKDLRISKVDGDQIISQGTFDGKKCTGTFSENRDNISLRYSCGKIYGSTKLYKRYQK